MKLPQPDETTPEEDSTEIDQTKNDTCPLATAKVEDITLSDRERFTQLLDELKKNLRKERFEELDALITDYWNNESVFGNS